MVEYRATRYTYRNVPCTICPVERLNITLEDEQAEKLSRLAERMHVQPGTIARSLLSSALDEADADARNVVALLDAIPGAYERAQLGLEQAKAGETVPLADL
jgi:predicted transcriptional regulator